MYLVSEMEILSNLEEVRIKTILQQRMSVFNLRGAKQSGGVAPSSGDELVAKIAEVRYAEKDKPNSPIMRIMVGDKRYYLHKNLSRVQDFELLKAVLSPDVKRIECFK